MSECRAACAGGGYVFICILPAGHNYSHLPIGIHVITGEVMYIAMEPTP